MKHDEEERKPTVIYRTRSPVKSDSVAEPASPQSKLKQVVHTTADTLKDKHWKAKTILGGLAQIALSS